MAGDAAPPSEREQRLTLLAMCFALFMIMLDNTIVNVALPTIQRDLGATPEGLEWVISGYVVSFASLIILGGKLGDRYGRRRIFLVGLGVFSLASAACALSATQEQLVGFRVLQGVGAAMLNPLSLSILVATFPPRKLPAAIGVWAGISGLGLAVGPLLGGLLTEHFSWSAVFWVNVPIGAVAAWVALRVVRESSDPTSSSLDVPGALLITGALFSLVWALIETNTHAFGSAYTLSFLTLGIVMLGGFIARESTAADPMIPLGFFARRRFSAPIAVMLLTGFVLFGTVYYMTLYFQNVKGLGALDAGLRTLPLTLMILVVAPTVGRINQRVGPRWVVTLGMTLVAGGMLGLTQLDVGSGYGAVWPFFVLVGTGIAMIMPTLSAAAMGAVEAAKSGVASGVLNTARQIGGALGIAVLGAVAAPRITDSWLGAAAQLPAPVAARADGLTELVVGGQGRVVGRIGGMGAQDAALEAFMSGMHAALYTTFGLTVAAAVLAVTGLSGGRSAEAVPSGHAVAAGG